MWRARDLTLFGRVLIIKSLGLSKIIDSISNIEAPDGIASAVRKNLSNFIWKNKKDRTKRTTLYQDLEKGGILITDVDLMFRSLRLAWIPRLLTAGDCNWCTVPYHFFRKLGGLNFLLKCNCDPKHLPQPPIFYRNIIQFFKELKTIYGYDQGSGLVLFNNREILVDNKAVYINNWVENDVISIKDLLKDDGNYLPFQEFTDKFACKTNFLQYYQIINAIPNHLLLKARQVVFVNKEYFTSNDHFFYFNNNVGIKLDNAISRDFYQLLIDKTHKGGHTGPKRWSENLSLNEEYWGKIFKSLRTICKETKLREFQYKFIHRTVVTKGELFKYGIKPDDECCFCGEKDSLDHTFIHCSFTKSFVQKVTLWFNKTNNSQFSPTTEELLFGIITNSPGDNAIKKLNYTTLFMCYYIFTSKLNSKPISLLDFIDAVQQRYILENSFY